MDIKDIVGLGISSLGFLATSITAYLIWKQVKVANNQTKELIDQNYFTNDYLIYKESFDRVESYFSDMNLNYKQDNYMTYFPYDDDKLYLDNQKDFLQNENDFKEAIMKSNTILAYLDYVVGHIYKKSKRITTENLALILKPVSNYILLKENKESEKNKNYTVSFLFYTFWCYDWKEGKIEFSYPNLLKYFNENNSTLASDFIYSSHVIKSFINTGFVENSFYLLECMFPDKYDKDFLDRQKIKLTTLLKEYIEMCSKNTICNTNFFYFRFFVIKWNSIFTIFIEETNDIKSNKFFKPIFDKQVELTFRTTVNDGYYFDIRDMKLDEEDIKDITSLPKENKYLEYYYKKYRNFENTLKLYKNFNKSLDSSLSNEIYKEYLKVLDLFALIFIKEYQNTEDGVPINGYYTMELMKIFKPVDTYYFNKRYLEHLLIIKILEECKIYPNLAKEAK